MIVEIIHEAVAVAQPDEFTRLEVQSTSDFAAATRALAAAGLTHADEEDSQAGHVWLDIAALRAAALASGGAGDTEWQNSWDGMIGFARKHGWIRGDSVRAHVASAHSAQ
jgi:hypothetical protein